ncbi:hypothetical protein Rsub_03817 [Raphidocelis subcapitata]|uniref:Uncharacterized protein n=1 Tax=Raphidocelis subcapitata TaxID=307507 RepID=A0A2V0NWA2_9CHLO|nr:hypothetical protein Rsub_03817 [Raphidocelis subcapitata]|eukprot:GBF90962.1 hypothetical protein Rsub_03817 [Raphidocelis subcapitata]
MGLLSCLGGGSGAPLPPDRLRIEHLASGAGALQAASGLPAACDALAYEPTQRLLAVSAPGGRIKVFGRDGVERCMLGADAATRQLRFLDNRGALARVDADGQIELFQIEAPEAAANADAGVVGAGAAAAGVDAAAPSPPLARLRLPDGDAAICVEPAAREPFLLVGCRSGAVRVAAAINASGNPAAAARQARGLVLMPYTIPAKKVEARGEVTLLAAASRPPAELLLSVHSGSGAAVWDLRAQQLVAVVPGGSGGGAASKRGGGRGGQQVTAAAWLGGGRRGDLATGHASGDVCVWALPQATAAAAVGGTSAAPHASGQQPPGPAPAAAPAERASLEARLLSRLRVTSRPSASAPPPSWPILHLKYLEAGLAGVVAGDSSGSGSGSGAESEGGGADAAPITLPCPRPARALCVAPAPGSLAGHEEPAAVLALLDGGEIVAFDLPAVCATAAAAAGRAAAGSRGAPAGPGARQAAPPRPLRPAFQLAPRVTAARLRIIPIGRVPLQGLQAS